MTKKFPTMADLRVLNPTVEIRNRPWRERKSFYTLTHQRWELVINGKQVRGPMHGAFWPTRRDAETKALEQLAPYPGVVAG